MAIKKMFYLGEEQERLLKEIAGAEGVSEAEVVRRAIEAYARSRLDNPLLELIGAFKGGPAGGAREHDRHLYGPPNRDARP